MKICLTVAVPRMLSCCCRLPAAGDALLQVGGGGDAGPGGARLHLYGDVAVLISGILVDLLEPPGLTRLLEQLSPRLGHLVVDEDVVVGKASAVQSLSSHQSSRQGIPG